MIRRVILRRFKRFAEQIFELEGHVVLAGPNNMGKTTVLQAIAAWNLALNRWKQLNNYHRRGGSYELAPIARQAFMAVPVRNFEWLWNQRQYQRNIEIEVQSVAGWNVTMEFRPDSTEQIYVHPQARAKPEEVRQADLRAVYVPPMSGLSIEEPVYQRPKLEQLLGQARPGEIIRNLLLEAHHSSEWDTLTDSIRRLFGYELMPPDGSGADIVAEYRSDPTSRSFDICSAGSGFQQVLMLLTFLHTRPGAVLLLDEPDAHLHVMLQDAIYGELRSVAARRNSQLIIATHSEVIINTVAPSELCMLHAKPRRLVDTAERARLAGSLAILTQTDVMLALDARGILYLEGHTDLDCLREWARVLNHPVYPWLSTQPFWKPIDGSDVNRARAHYEAVQLIRVDLPGLILLDGDAHPAVPPTDITGTGLQRIKWRRYETENYLVHPPAIDRFIEHRLGGPAMSFQAKADADAAFEKLFGSKEIAQAFAANPFNPPAIVEKYLQTTKARAEIIPAILAAAGIHGLQYTHFHEIAAVMKPEEIHPEVKEKLDAVQKAFGL